MTNIATASGTNPQSLVIASSPSSVTVAAVICNPPAITSPPSATAVVGTPFRFTVTTCSTAVPRIRAFDLPQGLRLFDNHNGTATISGTPWVKDLSQQSATIRAIVKGQTKANQVFDFTLDQAPIFKSYLKYLATTGVTFAYPITTRLRLPGAHWHHLLRPAGRGEPDSTTKKRHGQSDWHPRTDCRGRLPDHDHRHQRCGVTRQPGLRPDGGPGTGDHKYSKRHICCGSTSWRHLP